MDEILKQIYSDVEEQVQTGEVLIIEGHFKDAFAGAYDQLRGESGSQTERDQVMARVAEICQGSPLVAMGMENWLAQTLFAKAKKLGWRLDEVQEKGQHALREMLHQDKVRALREQVHLAPTQLNMRRCLRLAGNWLAGKEAPQRKRGTKAEEIVEKSGSANENLLQRRYTFSIEPAGEPSLEESELRGTQEGNLRKELVRKQLEKAVENLDLYVEQGKISAADAEKLRKLHKVDKALKNGKIDGQKAERVRNSLMEGKPRYALEKPVRQEADNVARFTQVFGALKRIDAKYDPALRFLIEQKELVNTEAEDFNEELAVETLLADGECLELVISLMDRQDAEVRMIGAGLPPYSYVGKQRGERLTNLVIESEFVEELRTLSREQMADRLAAPEAKMRALQAAHMLCIKALIERLLKPTPIRREIRLLKVHLIIEDFFRTSKDPAEARRKAENFLQHRFSTLYPDMSEEEKNQIEARGFAIIEAAERKVAQERGELPTGGGKEDQVKELEEDDRLQMGRVAMRVAGVQRMIAYRIMRDEDDPSQFVLARKDPNTGEPVPLLRSGHKRYVTQHREGHWELC